MVAVASPARRLSDEEARKLMTEQAALVALTKHPSWPTAVAVVENKVSRLEAVALARVLSPTGLDPAKAAYMSGLRDGIRYLLSVCHGAEDRLEGVLKRHGVQPEGE